MTVFWIWPSAACQEHSWAWLLPAQEQSDYFLYGVKQAGGGGQAHPRGWPKLLRPLGSDPKRPVWLGGSVSGTEFWVLFISFFCQKRQRLEDQGCIAGQAGRCLLEPQAVQAQNPGSVACRMPYLH